MPDFKYPLLTFLQLCECLESDGQIPFVSSRGETPLSEWKGRCGSQRSALCHRSLSPSSVSRLYIKIQGHVPHFLHNACVQIFACSSGSKEPEDTILTVVLSQTIAVLCLCE